MRLTFRNIEWVFVTSIMVTYLTETVNSSACSSSPCKNGATCVLTYTEFYCLCTTGYGGPVCNYAYKVCAKVADVKLYEDAKTYWASVDATVESMVGGEYISKVDIQQSFTFITKYLQPKGKVGTIRAMDGGAGIGRVSKHLLLPLFNEVDLVEIDQTFLDKAKNGYIGNELSHRVGDYYCMGVQEFYPPEAHYDVIWLQWVICQLKDEDAIETLKRFRTSLTTNGVIVIKDNIAKGHKETIFDEVDSSYIRTRTSLVSLIKKSGLEIIDEEIQQGMPPDYFQLRMFAVK